MSDMVGCVSFLGISIYSSFLQGRNAVAQTSLGTLFRCQNRGILVSQDGFAQVMNWRRVEKRGVSFYVRLCAMFPAHNGSM